MIRRRFFLLILFTALVIPSLSATELRIGGITTELGEKTRRNSLLRVLAIQEGMVFPSLEELDEYLLGRVRLLEARRIFKEIETEIQIVENDVVDIHIRVEDSFTLFPRPMLKYASDTGVVLGANVEYKNAFGSLTDYQFRSYWSPAEYLIDLKAENFPLGRFNLSLWLEQFDGTTQTADSGGTVNLKYRNSLSTLRFGMETALDRRSLWFYSVQPGMGWEYNYREFINDVDPGNPFYDNSGFTLYLDHGIRFEKITWMGNFRRGVSLEVFNFNTYYFGPGRMDGFIEADAFGFLPLAEWFSLGGTTAGFYAYTGIREDAGDRIRGVLNYNTYGIWGVYGGLQTGFRPLFIPRLGEVQIQGFVEGGYIYHEDRGHGAPSWEGGAGFSVIAYVTPLPSLVFSFDLGWDLKRGGTEIIVNTELFY